MPVDPSFRVAVAVGQGPADYEVLIGSGLLGDLASICEEAAAAPRWAIVTDRTVADLYGDAAASSFERCGLAAEVVAFEPGEPSKTRETWARLTDQLFDMSLGRDGAIVALGGGVVGDLAGFVAATYMRGLPFVQAPTTLLAMVDAAVGGKTGVDVPAGKNLVGAFRWPSAVVVDPDVLRTLPDDVYRAGLAEAVKHAVIADADHLSWLEERTRALLERDGATLTELVRTSVSIKAGVVSEDPTEAGRRAILNFGHTVAHALERHSEYRLPHGFAVAIGLVVESRLGERLGITEAGTAARLSAILSGFGLPVAIPAGVPAQALSAHARLDKKNRRSEIRCALLARPGRVVGVDTGQWTVSVAEADLEAALAEAGADASTASGINF